MATQPITQMTSRPQSGSEAARAAQMTFAARRPGRRGAPWSLPAGTKLLRQPQDGAQETSARIAAIVAHLPNSLREPEDARLTGGTRSLMRRVSGLNVTAYRKIPEALDRSHVA